MKKLFNIINIIAFILYSYIFILEILFTIDYIVRGVIGLDIAYVNYIIDIQDIMYIIFLGFLSSIILGLIIVISFACLVVERIFFKNYILNRIQSINLLCIYGFISIIFLFDLVFYALSIF
jgi:hypothetical protein